MAVCTLLHHRFGRAGLAAAATAGLADVVGDLVAVDGDLVGELVVSRCWKVSL